MKGCLLQRPLQLYLPEVSLSPNQPEIQLALRRAALLWRGEDIIWFLPDILGPVRWLQRDGDTGPFDILPEPIDFALRWTAPIKELLKHRLVLAVPSKTINCVSVHHVSVQGEMFGCGTWTKFPPTNIGDFLTDFLWQEGDGISFYPFPIAAKINRPIIERGKVHFELRDFPIQPCSPMPIKGAKMSKEGVEIEMSFSAPNGLSPIIAPEVENNHYYRGATRLDTTFPYMKAGNGELGIATRAHWNGLANVFAHNGINLDDYYYYAQLRDIAAKSTKNLEGCEFRLETLLTPYLAKSNSCIGDCWFGPLYVSKGESAALMDLEGAYNIEKSSLTSLFEDPEAVEELSASVPVDRVYGVIGLAGILLLTHLKNASLVRFCENCQKPLINGSANKKNCGSENPFCSKDRSKKYQRRSRARKSMKST